MNGISETHVEQAHKYHPIQDLMTNTRSMTLKLYSDYGIRSQLLEDNVKRISDISEPLINYVAEAIDKQLDNTLNLIVPLKDNIVNKSEGLVTDLVLRGRKAGENIVEKGKSLTGSVMEKSKSLKENVLVKGKSLTGNVLEKSKGFRDTLVEKSREYTVVKRIDKLGEKFLTHIENQLSALEMMVSKKYDIDVKQYGCNGVALENGRFIDEDLLVNGNAGDLIKAQVVIGNRERFSLIL